MNRMDFHCSTGEFYRSRLDFSSKIDNLKSKNLEVNLDPVIIIRSTNSR